MANESSDEYREFVAGLVPLESVHEGGSGGSFSDLASRIAGGRTSWSDSPAFLYGGGLMLAAAALAALMPSQPSGSFWRAWRGELALLLSIGNTIALPLFIFGLASLGLTGLAVTRRSPGAPTAVLAACYLGGGALAAVALLWVGVLAVVAFNALITLLIGLAIIVGTILLIAFFFAVIWGMISGQ